MNFSPAWLSDPEVFSVGELPPFSDHRIYATLEEAEKEASSLVRSLDGSWKAHYALRPSDAPESLLTSDEGDSALEAVTIPGEFQLQNPQWDPPHYVNTQYPWDGLEALQAPQVSDQYNPTVTVIRTFHLTAEEAARQVILTFEAAEAALLLYVNGTFVGYAEDSFTPHHFDLSACIHAGENRIAARIFKRCTGSWIEDQDFWRFSGIHRSVTLTIRPRTHLQDLFVHTPLTQNYTCAHLEAELVIDNPKGSVTIALTDKAGHTLLEKELPAAKKVSIRQQVEGISLWSAESPTLYTLTITLKDEMGVAEVSRTEVGFRQFEMIDKIMCLNGQRIVFHGVNRHEFDCDLGRVMTDEVLLQDIRDMKGMNINAVRTCHYPNDSRFYRLCDQYGLYVIDETNIESHGSWAPMHDWVVPESKPEWREMTLYRGRSMQERDKNHPSILLWSCGNESWGGTNLLDLANMFRQRDPSRLVHYEGVCHTPDFAATTDVYSRMYHKVADIEEYLNNNPDKPFINCEYTHAMGNSCGGMSLYTALESKYPMYQGGFIWDYVDQALRTTAPNGQERLAYGGDFGDRPTDWQFNTNGLILGDRTFTGKVQEMRHLFSDVTLTPAIGQVEIHSHRLFAPLTGMNIAWKVLADGQSVAEGLVPCPQVLPGEKCVLPLPMDIPVCTSQLIITCFLEVAEEGGLLEKGFRMAFGQCVCTLRTTPAAEVPCGPVPVKGDNNTGLFTPHMHALLGKVEGGLISFHDLSGKETILRAPQLSLFRAWTDNDHGNKYQIEQGIWHAASRYYYTSEPVLTQKPGDSTITYTLTSPLLKEAPFTVSYQSKSADTLCVTLSWTGAENLPDLAAFGLSFQLDPRLSHVEYLGMGPDENYIDRCTGAYLDWFRYEVKDGMTRYEKPQESGNRMGVRCLRLTDDNGHGLEVTGDSLEVSVMPYLPEEIACAYHFDELQGSCRTVLDIATFRKGIGGDDSWGAPVLPQFTYPSNRPYTLSFTLKAL